MRNVGEKVSVNLDRYPGVWVVVNNGPKNATLEPVNGGRKLRCPYSLLTDPVEGAKVPMPELFAEGELVRINDGKFAGLWVVIKDDGGNKVNLAKLGGDNGRYLRTTKRGLVRIDISEVLK